MSTSHRPTWATYQPARACAVRGCTRQAYPRSHYCPAHRDRWNRFGTPTGRAIRTPVLKPYLAKAEELLAVNAGRPSVLAAVDWLRLLINRPQSPALYELTAHLRARQVKPEAALQRLLGVWLLSVRAPGTLSDDERLTFELARVLLRMAHRPSTRRGGNGKLHGAMYPKKSTRALGELLRRCLGAFFQRLIDETDTRRDREAELLAVIRTDELPEKSSEETAP